MSTVTERDERIALARAALASAELRTGARRVPDRGRAEPRMPRGGDTTERPGPGLTLAGTTAVGDHSRADTTDRTQPRVGAPAHPRADVLAHPRAGVTAEPITPAQHLAGATATAHPPASHGSVLLTDRPPLPVPPAITSLLPDGLRRGGTTAVLGSTSLVLAMIAAACTAREAWAAVVGQPSIGLVAAAEAGVGLDRLALVPRPGPDAPSVLAALLDGLDLVVVGPGAALQDSDRRRLMARARDRGSVLLATTPWPGAGCVLTVTGGRWTGPGEGDGRLRARELHLTRTGRGAAGGRPEELDLVLPYDGRTDPYGLPAPEQVPAVRPAAGLRLVG
ncbi:hypothetical protein [Cellulomonas denverensis]|uniref:Uncharacterized protein n=1 Tax=Cellulomonas denverensis TaxID=264297 RepID=A0A7X6KUL7_9CELL|nr:hypothetical protein [Cellulomonas denverensis]NKY22294.1 hypothetical protein [Cellulomonas denverensis]GIG25877.1 hypothetical protein Cde04nite_21210 [Cellulomonas denverensis]